MKIYFAGSITGGRGDQNWYMELITLLGSFGEVLTEHIGSPNITSAGEHLNFEELFSRDAAWLEASDVVVAEVTQVSLGVGYELGIAEKLNKKVLCLYRPSINFNLSSMILGNKYFIVRSYENLSEAQKILEKELV